jgi:hypothetical protein
MPSPANVLQFPRGERVVIEFKEGYQPVGLGSEKLRSLGEKLIRSRHFSELETHNWMRVSIQKKEDIWATLMVGNVCFVTLEAIEL